MHLLTVGHPKRGVVGHPDQCPLAKVCHVHGEAVP